MAPLEAINIENSILGSIILDNTLAYKLDELSKDMFSVSYNKEIFEIMKSLYKNNYTLDIPTIKTKLDERKVDVMVSYISNLSSIGETYAIDTHINILKDKFKRKCIKNSCMNLITEILENKDIDSSLFKFENDIKSTVDQDIEDKDDMSSICERILDFLENDKETNLKFGVPLLDDVIGGLLVYGIPDFKLEKWVVDRRIDLLKQEGIKFKTNIWVGRDYPAKILKKEYDIIVLTGGATQARDLALLDEKYVVTKIQPVDMFPHTHHIENVVQLKLRTV